jgi:AmmeMemoRadiSam system protein B/AmmeMemoRadiSam system protein A
MIGAFCRYLMASRILLLSLLIFYIGCDSAGSEVRVREATHADGLWYPSTAGELSKTVDGFLAEVKKEPVSGRIVALIAPHAGYSYCGNVAAHAYKQIEGMKFDTVVLIGPSHSYRFSGASVYESGIYRNPLGDVEVDSAIAKRLIDENDAIEFHSQVHVPEHCLENQIPFLQRTLSKFKIVPIIMGNSGEKKDRDILSKALASVLRGKNVLLIASTDMSHYPSYDEAVKADKVTISALETMNPDLMDKRLDEYMGRGVRDLHCMLCGREAVLVVMTVAKELGADSVKVIKYANSGDVPKGDKGRVVGYMAAVIYDSGGSKQKASGGELDTPLNEEQQEALLKLARERIETYVKTGEKKKYEIPDERMKVKQGAFVTLKKGGILRGCIGHIVPIEPLCDTVADMAIAAATEDPRFPPVTTGELKDILIEISVLSVPRRVQSAEEIELGKHGVIVKRGMRQGVFLPQVATETGWDKDTFLEHLCWGKAGLPKDAWKDKDTELYVFTAQLFEE